MATYDLGKVVGDAGPKGDKGDTGATGNGIQSIVLRSTVGKVKTYRITFTNGDTFDFQVTDGEDGSSSEVEIVTSWNNTLSDEKVPSEKLSKNSLDAKAPTSHASSSNTYGLGTTSNYGHVKTVNGLTQSSHSNGTALSAYQGYLLNNAISGKADASDIPTKTSDLTNDSNYISTSSTSGLIKNDGTIDTNAYITNSALTNYVQKSNTSGLIKNDGTIDTTSYSTFSGDYDDLTDKPTIPSKISDLTNDSDFIETSSTTGLIKNDGTIMTSGTGSANYAVGNHTHTQHITSGGYDGDVLVQINNGTPISILSYLNSNFVKGSKVNSWQSTPSDNNVPSEKLTKDTLDTKANASSLSAVATSGSYADLSNKPTIPSKISDLTNDSDFIETSSTEGVIANDGSIIGIGTTQGTVAAGNHTHSNYISKSSTAGLIKNDGTIDTNSYLTSSALSNYVQKSNTSGLIKNDGTIDTSAYITSSAISGMLTSSDIADNLTTNDSTKVLSAKQGKALKDLIGDAITYINQ